MFADELTGADSDMEKDDGTSAVPHRPSKADKKVRHVVQSKLPGEFCIIPVNRSGGYKPLHRLQNSVITTSNLDSRTRNPT
jgi:hypothetical protein